MESFGMVLSRANTQCHCHLYFRYIATAIEALASHRGSWPTLYSIHTVDNERIVNLLRKWSHLGWHWAELMPCVNAIGISGLPTDQLSLMALGVLRSFIVSKVKLFVRTQISWFKLLWKTTNVRRVSKCQIRFLLSIARNFMSSMGQWLWFKW